MSENPYVPPVLETLPRVLALYDRDSTSDSYGMGDRYHWAWGLIDFGNATFQGAAHGMARLWRHGLWPFPTDREPFLARIDALFRGAARLTRPDGSLEEAFPYEGSFCVTALVAFDLLCALDLLRGEADEGMRGRWQSTIQPMIGYLLAADETHAFISNHLATAVAALARWHALTSDLASERKAEDLLHRILDEQSGEGWFREYEGADPGYQSLCTYYLADVHRQRPDWGLGDPLARSIGFLWHFAHPDGSFGGLYGSRCTRFYYPAGIEALAEDTPEAAALADFMANAIPDRRVVTLASIDEPNLAPMFNAYCWAASLRAERRPSSTAPALPALRREKARVTFPEAGIWIDAGTSHYTIIATHKGGVIVHFRHEQPVQIDAGVVVRGPKGALGSSQSFEPENRVNLDGDILTIESPITPMPKRLPTPLQFILLRLLCVSVFRVRWLRERAKQALVRLLITGRKPWPARNIRRVRLGSELSISDELVADPGYKREEHPGAFVAIHMASQGYWQVQDEGNAG